MKRLFFILGLSLFLVAGCSKANSHEATINAPYETFINNTTFTYYDTEDDITTEFNILDNSVNNYQSLHKA
jgi:hypothetical protein